MCIDKVEYQLEGCRGRQWGGMNNVYWQVEY